MGRTLYYKEIENFTSFNNIRIRYDGEKTQVKGDSITISLKIYNHRTSPLNFTNANQLYIALENEDGEKTIRNNSLSGIRLIDSNEEKEYDFIFDSKDLKEGSYSFIIGFSDGITTRSVNSNRSNLLITKN